MSPAMRFVTKLSTERCLVCSIWQTFLSSSLTVSMTDLFLSISLSFRSMSEFFMFFLILVTRCRSSTKSISKRSWLIYPLSAKSFPKSFAVKRLSFSGARSSTFPGVSCHLDNLPFVVDDQMQLEFIEPAHGALPLGSPSLHGLVLLLPLDVA